MKPASFRTPKEQQAAEAEGWHPTPTPKPPSYPQISVEIDRRCGTQYRHVMIHNPQEEKVSKENTDSKNWTEDNYPNAALAGTTVALSDLVAEHHARPHHALDDDLRNPTLAEAGDVATEPDSDNVGYERG